MFVAYIVMGYIVLVVSILFPWCASVDSGLFDSVCFISFVKSSQFAFL